MIIYVIESLEIQKIYMPHTYLHKIESPLWRSSSHALDEWWSAHPRACKTLYMKTGVWIHKQRETKQLQNLQFSFSNQPKLIQVTLTNPPKKSRNSHGKKLAKKNWHIFAIFFRGLVPSAGFVKIVSSRFCVTMPLVPVQSPLTSGSKGSEGSKIVWNSWHILNLVKVEPR